ncbi:hypothetical protein [Actinocorallia populi]|uniref:hypothetical protein n=1 Tax=Actinocorallia populi TaxID=2079200 RepID=UPI000D089239|nr:hypothetical protein [Actinocorallia populi]
MRRITGVATGLALVVGGLAYASPAHAAVATKITIRTDRAPAHIGDEVTVSGKLTRSSGSALGGRDVLLNVAGKRKIVRTNSDGLYIAEFRVPKSGTFTAEYLGSDSYDESAAATAYYALQYRTFVDGFSASPRPIEQNKTLTITGRTNRIAVSGDERLTGAGLDLLFTGDGNNWSYVSSTTSDNKGRFRFTPTVGQDGTWKVVLKPNLVADGWLQAEREVWVDSRYRTSVSGTSAKSVRYKGKIRVHGELERKVDGAWGAYGGVKVGVYQRVSGSKKWRLQGWAWVNKKGEFSKRFTVKRDGRWKVVYQGNGSHLSDSSRTWFVNVR